jgi:hypothetical protein
MIQLFPKTAMRESGHAWMSEPVNPNLDIFEKSKVNLNKTARKYGIVTPRRMAAFYANAMVETQWFNALREGLKQKKKMVDGKTVIVNGKAVTETIRQSIFPGSVVVSCN